MASLRAVHERYWQARRDLEATNRTQTIMATSNSYFSLVRTGNSTWTAVHVDHLDAESSAPRASDGDTVQLFSASSRAAFAERFPRLTIAMISLVLFAVSITCEVEWLHQAGYYWR